MILAKGYSVLKHDTIREGLFNFKRMVKTQDKSVKMYYEVKELFGEVDVYVKVKKDSNIVLEEFKKFSTNGLEAKAKACEYYKQKVSEFFEK